MHIKPEMLPCKCYCIRTADNQFADWFEEVDEGSARVVRVVVVNLHDYKDKAELENGERIPVKRLHASPAEAVADHLQRAFEEANGDTWHRFEKRIAWIKDWMIKNY